MVKARNLLNAGIGATALLLAGCGDSAQGGLLARAQAPCPRIGVLGEAADLTRFRAGGGSDLTAMVVTAKVSGFQATCDYTPERDGLSVTLTPGFTAERGPAAPGPMAEIPYMVAVVGDDDRILSQARYALQVEFPPNVARVRSTGEPLSITLPGGVQAAATRRVLVGFLLSPEELAANRSRGAR